MKSLLAALPLFALAACGEEPAPEPVPTQAASVAAEPTAPPANEALFKQVFANSCPAAETVSTAVCKRALGSDEAVCEFGLGEDTALRHDATMMAVDGEWQLKDAEALCAEHDSHHVDS